MHKAFTRHCLSDAIKALGVEVKAYARTARDNAYIVARGFAPRTARLLYPLKLLRFFQVIDILEAGIQ